MTNIEKIHHAQEALKNHPVYSSLKSRDDLHLFMRFHIFAVWDFMTLLKSLQQKLTCTDIPWRPKTKIDRELTRLINEIVLAEESDVDQQGRAVSHFELYLEAMEEVGADISEIEVFLETLDLSSVPKSVRQFVSYHLNLATEAPVQWVAAAFVYGREQMIPQMFQGILTELQKQGPTAKKFSYYLERHIELDGNEHGAMAQKCLDLLCRSEREKEDALAAAVRSLELRERLWDEVLSVLEGRSKAPCELR